MPPLAIALTTAFAVFILGNLYRAARTARLPLHLRWELYPIPRGPRDRQRYGGSYFEETEWWTKPAHPDRRGELTFMLKEALFLRGVFENFRALWTWSLLLHWGLYFYMASTAVAVLVFVIEDHLASGTVALLLQAVSVGFGFACALGVAGSVGLIATRGLHSRLKGFTSRATAFNLCLLATIFATGLMAPSIPDRGFLAVLHDAVDWRSATGEYPASAYLHFGLVAFFLIYFPFTHMTHMFMKYFTWHRVRWDDAPARFDNAAQAGIAANLARRVSWEARHIDDGNVYSWADMASGKQERAGRD
jgi:nitrate reductase gamma subunit